MRRIAARVVSWFAMRIIDFGDRMLDLAEWLARREPFDHSDQRGV